MLFDPFLFSAAATATVGSVQLTNGVLLGTESTGSSNPPFSFLSTAYQNLLNIGLLSTRNVAMTNSDLSPGAQYEFQVWTNDLQLAENTVGVNDGAGHSVNLTTGTGSYLGQFVTGTFTADATTQAIGFTDVGLRFDIPVNAFQLRLLSSPVPEPSSFFLTALAALSLIGIRRRLSSQAAPARKRSMSSNQRAGFPESPGNI